MSVCAIGEYLYGHCKLLYRSNSSNGYFSELTHSNLQKVVRILPFLTLALNNESQAPACDNVQCVLESRVPFSLRYRGSVAANSE
jgi:hypothetical protein